MFTHDQTHQFKSIIESSKESLKDNRSNCIQNINTNSSLFKEYLKESRDVYQSMNLAIYTILDSFPEYCLLTRSSVREHQKQQESYSSNLAQQRLERSQILLSLESKLESINDRYESLVDTVTSLPTFLFKSKKVDTIPVDILAFSEGCLQCLNHRFSVLSTLAVKMETIRKERELILNEFSIWSSKFITYSKKPIPTQDNYYKQTVISDHQDDEPIIDSQILEQEAKQLFQSSTITFQSSELAALEEAVKSVQTIGELQNILSLHVESQSHTITTIYDDAILSYDHIKRGHDYLKRASSDPQGPFRLASMFLLVLTFAIIFLDWFD